MRSAKDLRRYQALDRQEEEQEHLAATKGRFTYIPATVVKMSRNNLHNYIILNKGSEDGVRPYSGIISEQGWWVSYRRSGNAIPTALP